NCSPGRPPRAWPEPRCGRPAGASASRELSCLPVHRARIEGLLGVAKFEHRAGLAQRHRAIEARAPPGMAGARALLLHLDPLRVLIAVDAHLQDALAVTRGFAFAPEALARAAEVASFAACDGLLQRLRVHVGNHQYVAGSRIGHHASNEPLAVEFRREG